MFVGKDAAEDGAIVSAMTLETLKTTNGYYCGTRVNGSWFRWYRPWGFFTRGNGEIWVDPFGLHFRLYLTKPVRDIPLASIQNISIGDCGFRWLGAPVIWIEWNDGRRDLLSPCQKGWTKPTNGLPR